MISCLLVQNTSGAPGILGSREIAVFGNTISIGRSEDCKIRLLDYRIAPHHATLGLMESGALYIQPEGDAEVGINGVDVKGRGLLWPGDRISIGPCLLMFDPKSAVPNILLSIDRVSPLPKRPREAMSLTELRLSKRGLSITLLILLIIALFLPGVRSSWPLLGEWLPEIPAALSGAWSPGPMSSGHAAFGTKCASCHAEPFRPVADDTCTHCHKNVEKHPMGQAAHADLFKGIRCASCHAEHRENPVAVRNEQSRCVSCHGDIKSASAKATSANIHDFAVDHPPFRLTAKYGKDGRPTIRMLPGAGLKDEPGLKYSHKVHLAKGGVSSPEGNTVMACKDCHRLEPNGMHFAPIRMKRDCQQSGCHALDYDEPGEGEAPHGSERDVLERLRGYYLRWLSASKENMAQCKDMATENPAELSMTCASELARRNAAANLFDQKLGCGECHTIQASDDPETPWKIAPVNINRDWYANSVFPHAKHEMTACTACHDKTNSSVSADVAMPTMEKCRECHGGDKPVKGKVSGTCQDCHRFHGEIHVAKE